MLIALTHAVSPQLQQGEVTFIDRQPLDFDLALYQHQAYCQALATAGAEVKTLSVNLAAPDSCFIEDTAIVVDEAIIVTRIGSTKVPTLTSSHGSIFSQDGEAHPW